MVSTHWRKHHRPSDRELRFLDLLASQAADLIEQRQAEAALRESEEKYRSLFNSMDKAINLVWQETTAHPNTHPVVVMGDSDRRGQVICNLLNNAIKFTPASGSVTLELTVIDNEHSPDAPTAEIRVTDTGIGIAADFLPHMFERFRQARDSDSVKGLGLGLA